MTPADDIRLSKNFTYEEGIRNRHNIPNVPSQTELAAMRKQAEEILEPLRAIWNKKVLVTSFFRNEVVNRLARGHKDSAHKEGRATDLVISGVDTKKAFDQIRVSNIPYDKLIYETNRDGGSWIHIQHEKAGSKPRRLAYISYEVLDEKAGKYNRVYEQVVK